ncbi:MAG: glycosyltransferase family 2 protein [Candidatus Cloacimonetes bacterium]|nr:glycosyltransferase family 2 protein [Candidatus Cloacimonadota bacterium]MCF7869293.1 glycosyltransferase family 2 protein [Candidatus Cloacimonadota bacterium]MCF7884715.1 glycosyltransferase family 2 protein [Candidatus Cloacimonadota bacterium]
MGLAVLVIILKAYVITVAIIMLIYTIRHLVFSINRSVGEQKLYYQDILDSDLPKVTVIVPMHNEELVAEYSMENIANTIYPKDKLEIIPIEDHSEDATLAILEKYSETYDNIHPYVRDTGTRGKPASMNEVMEFATGDVIIVFDADYLPPKGIIRDIAICFLDPEVGAVMGRVIPNNVGSNMLTRLLDMERTGGYQIDQQARYNLNLVPQYGGTVGGFRRKIAMELGGFNPAIITEDTELTFKLYEQGWKVVYANRAECYEEAPETWIVRSRQVSRWARGHCQVFFKSFFKMMKSKYLRPIEKLDGMLLLTIYFIPLLLLVGIFDSIALFFLGEMNLFSSVFIFVLVSAYSSFGNAAPFFQIGSGILLDGGHMRVRLLPLLMFNFTFYLWFISKGAFLAIIDTIFQRVPEWQKTQRFRK